MSDLPPEDGLNEEAPEDQAQSSLMSSTVEVYGRYYLRRRRRYVPSTSPYPIHQHLFLRQQQEQERRRMALTPPVPMQQSFRTPITIYQSSYSLARMLNSIKKRTVTMTVNAHTTKLIATESDETDTCVVCFSMFTLGQRIRKLPCNHKFHMSCIDEWFLRSYVCPVCRRHISKPSPQAEVPLISQPEHSMPQPVETSPVLESTSEAVEGAETETASVETEDKTLQDPLATDPSN